jgi:hypothetical protein
VFEANVLVELSTENGDVIAPRLHTTCTSCQTFSLALAYHVDHRQSGTIVVHDDDALLGTFPHESGSVVLTPDGSGTPSD